MTRILAFIHGGSLMKYPNTPVIDTRTIFYIAFNPLCSFKTSLTKQARHILKLARVRHT